MDSVFYDLASSYAIGRNDLEAALSTIKIDPDLIAVLRQLKEEGATLAIVSDANSWFISKFSLTGCGERNISE